MKRPKNPTKVITGIGTLGGDGECSGLLAEEGTVGIIDGNQKKKLNQLSRLYRPHEAGVYFIDLLDIFPTPYKIGQNLGRGDRFRFRIEVEVEVLK